MSENEMREDSMESPQFSQPQELSRSCKNCVKLAVCKSYLTMAVFELQKNHFM